MQVLTNDHFEKIMNLFDGINHKIKIVSPFISESMAKKLCDVVKMKNIDCTFITRFYLEDMFAKANSMDAMEMMMDAGIKLYALKGLHTKLYLFDEEYGVLGSANFTAGGFKSNVELSLLLSKEDNILEELHHYFDDLLCKIKECEEGLITKDILERARKNYGHTFSKKKESEKITSSFMYGASIDKRTVFNDTNITRELEKSRNETDIVNSMFQQFEQQEQIIYDHTIWLKFYGEANNRIDPKKDFPMTYVLVDNKKWYLSNYPFKVHSVNDGDEIYLAALSSDTKRINQPIIVGRGHLVGFTEENFAKPEWIKKCSWMSRFPWYCVIKDAEVLAAPVEKGITMNEKWDRLRSDTYISSFGKNESISSVAKKHYQKAHIRLSGNAKEYIDKRLNELAKQYGMKSYKSDI